MGTSSIICTIERLEAENKKTKDLVEALIEGQQALFKKIGERDIAIAKQVKVIEVVNDLCCGEDGMFSRRKICQEILSIINAEGK